MLWRAISLRKAVGFVYIDNYVHAILVYRVTRFLPPMGSYYDQHADEGHTSLSSIGTHVHHVVSHRPAFVSDSDDALEHQPSINSINRSFIIHYL
jgi:hypothetical protein